MLRTLVIASLLVACGDSTETAPPTEASTSLDKKRDVTDVIATVDGAPVGSEDLADHARRNRPADGKAHTPEERRALLDQVVTDELLFQKALDEGLYHDATVRRKLVHLLLRQEVYDQVNQADLTEEELRAYYDAHQADFVVGERVQARRIVIEIGDDRAAAEKKAGEILAQVKASPARFTEIAKTESSGPFQRRGGDLGFVPREGKPGVEPEVIEHAFSMAKDEIGGPFEVNGAFHILQVVNRRDAVERTYEQMKGSVMRMVKQQKFDELRDAYIEELKTKVKIVIDEEKVGAVDLASRESFRPAPRNHGHDHDGSKDDHGH